MKKFLLTAFVTLVVAALMPIPATAGGACAYGDFSDARGTVVTMVDVCFEPTVIRVEPGQTVTWHNKSGMAHAVGGVTNVFGDMHTEVKDGESVTYRFKEEGVFPYVCIFHPGMAGAVVVGDGEGKHIGDVAALVPPVDEDDGSSAQAAPAAATTEAEPDTGGLAEGWIVAFAVIALIGVLAIAAIPMGRARRAHTH